jgi:hypothetical protein
MIFRKKRNFFLKRKFKNKHPNATSIGVRVLLNGIFSNVIVGLFICPLLIVAQVRDYNGMCDASAALAVDAEHFIIANDEDNILRIYNINNSSPVSFVDLSTFLGIEYDDKSPEADFEGATKIGDYYLFISSHGRDRKGRIRMNRHQFFAVHVDPADLKITPVGQSYQKLMNDMALYDDLKKLGVYDAYLPHDKKNERLAPKKRGVNIEGLSATPDGKSVLIGFRNPQPGGKAIIVELQNPLDVVLHGKSPIFGKVSQLSMKTRGVRSLEYHAKLGQYLIVAGSHESDKKSLFYLWSGNIDDAPVLAKQIDFEKYEDFNPKAISIYSDMDQFQIFSDDGSVMRKDGMGGECACKELPDPAQKKYRGVWFNYTIFEQ